MGSMMLEEQYWQAVLARDPQAEGAFVYGVRSTHIYCRPTCPSRRPRRAQVVFFRRAAAAEQEGFRPCKRCRPGAAADPDPRVEWVQRACRYIEDHLDEALTLATLSAQVSLSEHYFQRSFKRIMGLTPRQYADARRLERLKTQLKAGDTVTGAMYEAGYGSSSRLYERAPAQLGMTPAAYRRGGAGLAITYTIMDSPVGRVLIGATERGVCAVSLGDADADLEAALGREYPAATLRRDDVALGAWAAALLCHLRGEQPHLDLLPLDVQATAFQWRVWEALRTIPYGETLAYGEVARRIGRPTAARAVAAACASNPVAVVIPCHRVVGAHGALGGYRWGVERKRRLLAQEQGADWNHENTE
jgi:AraC family transcriptional regulator of adaptative response/methylated-DNA-[protein]-cysteine methyltransferase